MLIYKYMKKITFGLVILSIFAIFLGVNVVNAQVTTVEPLQANTEEAVSYSYEAKVEPVKFFEKVKLIFTFDKEKKAEILQDFSSRNFELAKEQISEGNTEIATTLFQESDKNINKATDSISKIRDEKKQEEALSGVSATVTTRATVLTDVMEKVQNVTAKEAIGKAIEKQVEVKDITDAKIQALLNRIAELEAKIRELESRNNVNETTVPSYGKDFSAPLPTVITSDVSSTTVPSSLKPYKVPTVTTSPNAKCGVNTFKVNNECGNGMYRNVYAQCYDGFEITLGERTSCKSVELWNQYAKEACTNHCSIRTEPELPAISNVTSSTTVPAPERVKVIEEAPTSVRSDRNGIIQELFNFETSTRN